MKKIFSPLFSENKKTAGYTLLETVVYVGILSVLLLAIFTLLFSITRAFAESRVYNQVEISATTAMERMVREIRTANSVDLGNSIFDDNSGQLQLNTTEEDGTPKTVQFYHDSTNKTVNFVDNGADEGTLTGNDVNITKLLFRSWVTPKSTLIKIEMTVQSKIKTTLNANYYDSVVLRGAY